MSENHKVSEKEDEQTTAIVERHANYASLAEIEKASITLVNSQFKGPFKRKEDAIIAALTGRDLGMGITQSWNGIHVVNGRAALGAATMLGLIKRDVPTFRYKIILRTNTHAKLKVWNDYKGEPNWFEEFEYTWDDAVKSGKSNEPNYQRYPKQMLWARVVSNMARTLYPEVIMGLYTPEEVQFFDDGPKSSAIEVTPEPEKDIEEVKEELEEEIKTLEAFPTSAADKAELYKKYKATLKKGDKGLKYSDWEKSMKEKINNKETLVEKESERVIIDVVPEPEEPKQKSISKGKGKDPLEIEENGIPSEEDKADDLEVETTLALPSNISYTEENGKIFQIWKKKKAQNPKIMDFPKFLVLYKKNNKK